jgi:hypothetical protein
VARRRSARASQAESSSFWAREGRWGVGVKKKRAYFLVLTGGKGPCSANLARVIVPVASPLFRSM